MVTVRCPFCDSEITTAQLGEMRDKLRKGQDPAILQEIEGLRDGIRTQEKERANLEVEAMRGKLKEYQKRESELDRRDAEIKAREATIEAEVRRGIATRENAIREQITSELSAKQNSELEERDRQIDDLSKELKRREELKQAEVDRLVADRESKVRNEERARAEKTYEPLRGKIREYQQEEQEVLNREETLRIREQEMELVVQRTVQQKIDAVRLEEKSRLEGLYAPLRSKIEEYQQREDDFLRREQTLALREQEIELRVAREVASKRDEFVGIARKQSEERYGIELKERERMNCRPTETTRRRAASH